MSVRFPRLLDSNMNEVRRIRPLDGSLFLNIIPLSTASLTLETEQMIPVQSYVEMYNAYGSVGIFRVRTAGNTYGATSSTVELEHAICEVGDYICTTELNKSAPLNSAISELFAFYKGSKWRLGTITATDSVVVDISYDNVLEAILGLLEQAPEYMLTFDFSSSPWTINLARRGTVVSAEGRLGRNVQNASVSYDDSEVCTRAYIGWDNSKGKTTVVHYDADTIAQYGLIEKHLSGSGYTQDQARIVAQTYLKYHKKPKVAITITGYDFYNATGEPLDRLETGKLYRLALPKYGITVEENITGLAWAHLYSEPDNVEITLADVEDPVVAFVRKTQKSSSGNSKAIVKKNKEYWTKFDQTDYYMDLMAVHVDKHGNILEQAGMYLDSKGVLIYADNNPNQVGARFKVQAEAISAEVTRATKAEGTLSGKLTVESNRITAEVTRATSAESGLSGRITTEANRISLVVEGTGNNAKIKPASIVAAINGAESTIYIDADHVQISGATKISGTMEINGQGFLYVKKTMWVAGNINLYEPNTGVGAPCFIASTNGYVRIYGASSSTYYDLTARILGSMIKTVSISNNTLTLTKFDGNTVNFSKATWLTGEWSSSGAFTARAKQNNGGTETEVSSITRHLTTGTRTWNGNTCTVPIRAWYGSNPPTYEDCNFDVTVDASDRYNAGFNAVSGDDITLQGYGSSPQSSKPSIAGTWETLSSGKKKLSAYIWAKHTDGKWYRLRSFYFIEP